MTGPRADDGEPGRRRIRPYLSMPAAGETRPSTVEPTAQRARPFILTSGRVSSTDPYIGLESQVTTLRAADHLAPELRAILHLCADPQSVAEISARLRLHLGVTQILVGDLRAAGLVDVHTVDITHDPDIILRVINGLRALR